MAKPSKKPPKYRPKPRSRVSKVDTSRNDPAYWNTVLFDMGLGRKNETPKTLICTRGKLMRGKKIDPD